MRQVLVGGGDRIRLRASRRERTFYSKFRDLLDVDPGFTRDGVLTASTNAPRSRYPDDPPSPFWCAALWKESAHCRALSPPGATTVIPLGGDHSDSVIFAEGYVVKPGESLISPNQVAVTPGYFESMRIALLRGRYSRTQIPLLRLRL